MANELWPLTVSVWGHPIDHAAAARIQALLREVPSTAVVPEWDHRTEWSEEVPPPRPGQPEATVVRAVWVWEDGSVNVVRRWASGARVVTLRHGGLDAEPPLVVLALRLHPCDVDMTRVGVMGDDDDRAYAVPLMTV